jgi:hypothetical protein
MKGLILAIAVITGATEGRAGEMAPDWQALNSAEIRVALDGRKLVYAGASQVFYPSGRTLYDAGSESWGYWRAEDDRYCSQWPPAGAWDCYRLERAGDGLSVRFLDAEGRPFVGVYAK